MQALVVPSSKPNSVHVLFEVNRIVLTEDDTPGRAMDEASTWTGLQSKVPDISFDFHRDQRLGLTLGTGLSTPRYFFKSGVSLKFYWDGWISSSDGFYDMKAGFDQTHSQTYHYGVDANFVPSTNPCQGALYNGLDLDVFDVSLF